MRLSELWTLCPPPRLLSSPHQMSEDIQQLDLKRHMQPNSFPTFTDSNDLVKYIKKNFKKDHLEISPFDVLTKIHYKRDTYKGRTKYSYVESRPIHKGGWRLEESFTVKSRMTTEPEMLEVLYYTEVNNIRKSLTSDIRCTWSDMLLINRRLLEHNWRVLQRSFDNMLILVKYNWVYNELG